MKTARRRYPMSNKGKTGRLEQAQSAGSTALQNSAETIKPPYRFARIDVEKSCKNTPVWHDGSSERQETLYSGELRCTLTNLTPLLVANQALALERLQGFVVSKIDHNRKSIESRRVANGPEKFNFAKNKKLLQPLFYEDRVVIPGSSIKGMLRQSLGALLHAPMERVAERQFSYRPNLKPNPEKESKYRVYPAIVETADADDFTVRLIDPSAYQNENMLFVSDQAHELIPKQMGNESLLETTASNNDCAWSYGVEKKKSKNHHYIFKEKKTRLWTKKERDKFSNKKPLTFSPVKLNHYCFDYVGGTDGAGKLAKAFNRNAEVYRHVYIEKETYDESQRRPTLPVEPGVLSYYQDTVLAYLMDSETGLITSAHPLIGEGKKKRDPEKVQRPLRKNQLIYVEAEIDEHNNPGRIVSLGHNFYYRWRYRDSIRRQWKAPSDRDIVRPLSDELSEPKQTEAAQAESEPAAAAPPEHEAPQCLSGARLFFGFAAGDNSGCAGIGRGDFTQLAGRIAINAALADAGNRYCGSENEQYLVPLKQPGAPKASAVEFYLQQPATPADKRQDNGAMLTYGDLMVDNKDGSGELNGRKFYLHQPDAADWKVIKDISEDNPANENAPLGRYITETGGQFKFKLRFRALRDWELGVLLWILSLDQIKVRLPDEPSWQCVADYLATLNAQNAGPAQPLFAHKLGYGKPLGLGSVRIETDDCLLLKDLAENGTAVPPSLQPAADENIEQWIEQGLNKCDPETLLNWLKLHQYRGRHRCAYPGNGTAFNFHTQIRQRHAQNRRQKKDGADRRDKDILSDL